MVTGGDCGACVLGGLAGLSVPGAYGIGKPNGASTFSISDMQAALMMLQDHDALDRIVDEPPTWIQHVHSGHSSFGFTALSMAPMWYEYMRLAIDAGYYGLVTISFEPFHSKEGETYFGSNHWVLIKGCRFHWVPLESGKGSRGAEEILVSCSVKGDYWMPVREFARLHGGSYLLLARPA